MPGLCGMWRDVPFARQRRPIVRVSVQHSPPPPKSAAELLQAPKEIVGLNYVPNHDGPYAYCSVDKGVPYTKGGGGGGGGIRYSRAPHHKHLKWNGCRMRWCCLQPEKGGLDN